MQYQEPPRQCGSWGHLDRLQNGIHPTRTLRGKNQDIKMRDTLYPLWKCKKMLLAMGLQEPRDFDESRCQDSVRVIILECQRCLWKFRYEPSLMRTYVNSRRTQHAKFVCFPDVETLTGTSHDHPSLMCGDPESQRVKWRAHGWWGSSEYSGCKLRVLFPTTMLHFGSNTLENIRNLISQPCWKEFCGSSDNRYKVEPIF